MSAVLNAPTTGGVQANIRGTALQFLRWAHTNGLLAADSYYPGDSVGVPQFGEHGVSATAMQILRTRQVRFVSIDGNAGRLAVFLRRAAPTAKELKILPAICNGFAVRYHQGNPETVSPTAVAEATSTCAMHQVGSNLFYTCGSSISVGNNREAGTLGCLVKDATGDLFGLSNNHVTGACSYAPAGLPILAPGVIDVSPLNPSPFTLGLHARQLPMQVGDPSSVDHLLNSDAALFKITEPNRISSMQRGFFDTPTSILDLVPGMAVEKVGRTTGLKKGVVQGELIGAQSVSYSASQYGFSGGVFFEGLFLVHGVGDVFSEGGDSGSLVVHVDGAGARHAVGLLIAGYQDSSAPGGKISIVLPLRPILNKLGVTLVAAHNR